MVIMVSFKTHSIMLPDIMNLGLWSGDQLTWAPFRYEVHIREGIFGVACKCQKWHITRRIRIVA